MRLPSRSSLAVVCVAFTAIATPAAPPTITDVFSAGTEGYHTFRIPALVVTGKGTLLAICEGRKTGRGDHGDVDLVLKRSTDGGKTWSPTQLLYEEGGDAKITIGNPCPVLDRDSGTVWLPFTRDNTAVFVTHSKDDGKTWAKPTNITDAVKKPEWSWYATGPGVGIQLQDARRKGRLVIPCDHKTKVDGKDVTYSHVIYSDDAGKTWKLGGTVAAHTNECQIVELEDGTLQINMRNYIGSDGKEPAKGKRRAVSLSKDGGDTWSEPRYDAALVEPICQASLIRASSDQEQPLIFANPADANKRHRLTIRLSRDGGKTWPASKVLEEGPAAYSCLASLPDGSIGCLYERGVKDAYEKIAFATFYQAWLTDSRRRPHVVGHRGLRWDAPENTLASMRACLTLGVSIELDVRRSKDGQLIVLHDATLDRTTDGKGKAIDFTLAELKKLDAGAKFDAHFRGERIPTLEEVFILRAQHPTETGIIAVDLKEADTEEDIVRLAQKHKVLDHLVFIGLAIGEAEVRKTLRKASPAAHVARLVPAGEAFDAALKDEHADWIYLRHIPTRGEVEQVHGAGKRLFLSGPKAAALAPDVWSQAAEFGFDAILTDYPLPLARTLREMEPRLTRIASGVSGHIHPAACITKSGTIITIFSQSDMKDQRVSRSTDRGQTWSEPVPFAPTAKTSIYPGSLTTLRDGRVIHAWNVWYMNEQNKKSRFVQFSISSDEGKTWSEPKSLPKNPNAESIIRHPIVELSEKEWLFPLADQTVIYDPGTEKVTPFGDGRKHGLVPIVRTPTGFVSGAGLHSSDNGKTWVRPDPFPAVGTNGWRFEMFGLDNGWIVTTGVEGPGVGGNRWFFLVSRDDGKTWAFENAVELYNPGRAIGGRACPRTVQLDKDTLGTVLYDVDAKQPGGPGVFFILTPLAKFR